MRWREGLISWQVKNMPLGTSCTSWQAVSQIQEGAVVITELGSTNRPFIFTNDFQTLSYLGEGEKQTKPKQKPTMFFRLVNVKRDFDSWVEQKPFGKTDSRKAKKQYYFPLLWKDTTKINWTKHRPRDSAYRCLSLRSLGGGKSSKCLAMPASKHHLNGSAKSSNKAKLDTIKCRLGHRRVCVPRNFCQVTLYYTSGKTLHFLIISHVVFVPKQEQKLPNPTPVSLVISPCNSPRSYSQPQLL